jgi:CheY-like chemotaxis protein
VLVIDDQPDLVQVVQNILEARGFTVDTALSGKDGLALAEVSKYSVVVTDLAMPDLSGWELAERIHGAQPKTPIILITGWAADIEEDRLAEANIHAVLPKPFRSEQLFDAINDALNARDSRLRSKQI